jgi:hypothetical protein
MTPPATSSTASASTMKRLFRAVSTTRRIIGVSGYSSQS